jgi:curved DNA-binding protein CbpA
MPGSPSDPFAVLGVGRDTPDTEIRTAYRRLVQRHHPDHNGGSAESTRRFEEVQGAYAEIRRLRRLGEPAGAGEGARAGRGAAAGGGAAGGGGPTRAGGPASGGPTPPAPDPAVEARLADLERQVRDAHAARERAQQAARRAAAQAASPHGERRPSDEELGYVHTDDSFSQLLADARSELAARIGEGLDEAQTHPVAKRVSDLIDELTARLTGEGRG